MKSNFRFWQQWLCWVCIFQWIFGVGLVFFGPDIMLYGIYDKYRTILNIQPSGFERWIMGVQGATLAGWAAALLFIAHYAFKAKLPWARNAIVVSMAAWFPFDTGLSLCFGVWPNAIFNLVSLILVMIPVAMTWRDFDTSSASKFSSRN